VNHQFVITETIEFNHLQVLKIHNPHNVDSEKKKEFKQFSSKLFLYNSPISKTICIKNGEILQIRRETSEKWVFQV
jgi:phage pi2 protein 07